MSVGSQSIDRSIRRISRRDRRLLHRTGRLRVRSGSLSGPNGTLYGHSEFGPSGLDKDCNEDFVLLWAPSPGAARDSLDWAIAVADGVTSSYRSDLAAELVCWSSLASLVRSMPSESTPDVGREAIQSASASLRSAGRMFSMHTTDWRPLEEFASAWAYRIARGVFLQTTLTLAWCRRDELHLVRIGDGGAMLFDAAGADMQPEVFPLFDVNTETHTVQALGPVTPADRIPFDHLSFRFQAGSVLALYTDGVGRHVQRQPLDLWNCFHRALAEESAADAANLVIQQLVSTDAEALQDNLSLVFVTREPR